MKALRAWETPRRHRNPRAGNPRDYVAGRHRENAEGEETAREAVVFLGFPIRRRRQGSSTLERSERSREESTEREFSWTLDAVKTS